VLDPDALDDREALEDREAPDVSMQQESPT
jgi:hypothetical protein